MGVPGGDDLILYGFASSPLWGRRGARHGCDAIFGCKYVGFRGIEPVMWFGPMSLSNHIIFLCR
jgi:hypothetical protein